MSDSTQQYVDEEVQESLFETQMDAEATEASFKGFADSPVRDGNVEVRLQLPSGRTKTVNVNLPSAANWQGSTIHALMQHLGVERRDDFSDAVDNPVPVTTDGDKLQLDEDRLPTVSDDSTSLPSPAISEAAGDLLAAGAGILTWASFIAAGFPITGFIVGFIAFMIPFMYLTPRTREGRARGT